MLGKILIIVAVLAYGYAPANRGKSPVVNVRPAEVRSVNDSMPSLHMLESKDVDSLLPDFGTDRLTVKMKNGLIFYYEHQTWDYENLHFSLPKQIKEAIDHMQKTFTKVEIPPKFPRGEDSLENYIKQFCQQHKKQLKRGIPAEFEVQFIVHLHGEVREAEVIHSDPSDSKLSALAVQAIREGPGWIPAIQNGREVVSYARQRITLNL